MLPRVDVSPPRKNTQTFRGSASSFEEAKRKAETKYGEYYRVSEIREIRMYDYINTGKEMRLNSNA